jgi:hypothetical protein
VKVLVKLAFVLLMISTNAMGADFYYGTFGAIPVQTVKQSIRSYTIHTRLPSSLRTVRPPTTPYLPTLPSGR